MISWRILNAYIKVTYQEKMTNVGFVNYAPMQVGK